MSPITPAYFGREQTAVKHRILERYLTPLPLIVGRGLVRDVTFVDCCSGPWNTITEDLSDSSFGIAVRQLQLARETLAREGHAVSFRCLFVERTGPPTHDWRSSASRYQLSRFTRCLAILRSRFPRFRNLLLNATALFPFSLLIRPAGLHSSYTLLCPCYRPHPERC